MKKRMTIPQAFELTRKWRSPLAVVLRQARKAERVTLRKLAVAVGRSHVFLSELERGLRFGATDDLLDCLAVELKIEGGGDRLRALSGRLSLRVRDYLRRHPEVVQQLEQRAVDENRAVEGEKR